MRTPLSRVRTAVFVALAVASPAGPVCAQPRMTPELLWKLARVSDPQPSPDARTVLYTVRTYDLAANQGTSQLVLLDAQTGEQRQLTSVGSNFNGRWSPDGERIAFLSTRGGDPQIHVIAIDGGEARPVTDHEGGVQNLAWSPTGAHFSFTATVELGTDIHDRYPDLPEAEARIYDDLMVRHWDTWHDGTYSHLFVVPADGGEAIDLMQGLRVDTPLKPFGGGEQIAWSPDGRELCYTAKVDPDPEISTNSDLFVVRVDGGEARNLTDGMPGYEVNPMYAPDGSTIAFASMARAGYESDRNRLFVQGRGAAAARRELTEGWDLSVVEACWNAAGTGLWVTADAKGARQVFKIGLAGTGAPEPLTAGRWHFGSPAPSPDGRFVFATRMRTERPNEIVRIVVGDGTHEGVRITDQNGAIFRDLALPIVEERRFDATDGEKIHAWVIYPPGFDRTKKYPMLTYCQGGPQSQVGQWFSFRWNFHLMAAHGYIVLAVNRRGLPGFGTEWNEQISRDWGGQAMQDLLSATDQMFEQPFVDRDRTAAIGASFGGYTVYWLMGHDQEDRFCAMLAHCGVFHLESMYLSTEELFFVNWDLGGPYFKDQAIQRDYDRFSPHRFVQSWDTPLLVIHGQKDFRVPLEQGLQAFTAAQIQGVPSRFLYFPTESHWVLSPQNGVLWHREFFRWLDQWCKPEGSNGR